MKIELTWTEETDDGDEEISHEFEAKNEVCPSCEGFGTQLIEGLRGEAFTMSEFYESFPEEEDREAYFSRSRESKYNVACSECKGQNVIAVVDESKLNKEEKSLYKRYESWLEENEEAERRYEAEVRAERRFCGEY